MVFIHVEWAFYSWGERKEDAGGKAEFFDKWVSLIETATNSACAEFYWNRFEATAQWKIKEPTARSLRGESGEWKK